jgi:hypothetical protein
MAQLAIASGVRRKLGSYPLYAVLGVALTVAGLTLWKAHRLRRAEETTAELRRLGFYVIDHSATDPRWMRIARAAGLSTSLGFFERKWYEVRIQGTRDAAGALRLAARLPDLVILHICDAPNFYDDALAAVCDCTELEGLYLTKTGVTDAGLRHLQRCGKLGHVSIYDCPVTDEGIRSVCNLPTLTSVSCGRCLSETTLDDLAYASPGSPTPEPGRPLTITGRLRVRTPLPVATASLSFFVVPEVITSEVPLEASAVVTLDATGQAGFSVTARNGGAELETGRSSLYVTVTLPSTPIIRFQFGLVRSLPTVKSDSP